MLSEWLPPQLASTALRELRSSGKVDQVNRRRGHRIVLTHKTKKVKASKRGNTGFLRTTLEGYKTEVQIRVAAADMLKGTEGYHRTVCMVEANGLEYKVKCMHKGLTYTEAVHRCEVVSKRVL